MIGAVESIPIGEAPQDGEQDNVVRLPATGDVGGVTPEEEDLSWEEVVARDAEAPPLEPTPHRHPNADLAATLRQGMRVGLGAAVATTNLVAAGLRSQVPQEPELGADEGPEPVSLVAGATLGLAVQAADLAAKAFEAAAVVIDPVASWVANPPFLRGAADAGSGVLRVLDGRWQAEEASTQRAAEAFVRELVPRITSAIVDQLDLDEIIERIPIEGVVGRIDVNDIVSRVDLDSIVARIDINEIAERIDLNAVAAELNVDDIVSRVDLDAIIRRIDIAGIAEDVIEEVDLPAIIRESSGAMASETVQELRIQGMHADTFVAKIVDKVLRRRARDLDAPGEPEAD
jgi:hypothetical protein